MKKIYNYFINHDKHIKNKNINHEIANSLKQGNALLKNRRKFLNDLEYNLNQYNKVEGFGATGSNALLIDAKLKEFTEKKSKYELDLVSYETDYKSFKTTFDNLKINVQQCKTKCMATDSYKDKAGLQNACMAGCQFKGPYIKEAENTFVDNDTSGEYSCSETGTTNCEYGKKKPGANINVYTDSKGTSIESGCTVCGGGRFGKPKYIKDGDFIQNCSSFNDNEKNACTNAEVVDSDKVSGLVATYARLSTNNQNLLILADEMLEIVNGLKKYNFNLINDKTTMLNNHEDNAHSYKSIQDEIKSFIEKKPTLNMLVGDSILKKKSYDLRIYIWLILAIGLGFVTLNKIRKF